MFERYSFMYGYNYFKLYSGKELKDLKFLVQIEFCHKLTLFVIIAF